VSDTVSYIYHVDLCSTVHIAEGEWKLVVRTSDFDNAGTSAQVFVTFYGVKSHSDELRLMSEDSKPFQRGKESTFTVFIYHFHAFNFLLKILAEYIVYITVHCACTLFRGKRDQNVFYNIFYITQAILMKIDR